jgi:predicted ribosome quality control (RQC) complex YloA/Tae2 family protein
LKATKPRILAYELPGNWTLLLGASDADNDYLSTQVAEPRDWWFHADGVPGSHVILRAKQDEEPSKETLRQAAAVAAYHSKARNAGTTSVHCTRARYVKKPRGVKTGTVQVAHGTTLKVRPDISFATRVPATASLGISPAKAQRRKD